MTLDEKVRLGMMGIAGATMVLSVMGLGVHLGPLRVAGTMGTD